jgi:hypothetical protein
MHKSKSSSSVLSEIGLHILPDDFSISPLELARLASIILQIVASDFPVDAAARFVAF